MAGISIGAGGIGFSSDTTSADFHAKRRKRADLETAAAFEREFPLAPMTAGAEPRPTMTPTTAKPQAKPATAPASTTNPSTGTTTTQTGTTTTATPQRAVSLSPDRRSLLKKVADSIYTDVHFGYRHSKFGQRSDNFSAPVDEGGTLADLVTLGFDSPVFAAGALMGSPGGLAGVAAGMFALPEAAQAAIDFDRERHVEWLKREAEMWDLLNNPDGEELTFEQTLERAKRIGIGAVKGGAEGLVLHGAGRLAAPGLAKMGAQMGAQVTEAAGKVINPRLAPMAGQVAGGVAKGGAGAVVEGEALGWAGAAAQGELPTPESLVDAITLVAAMKGGHALKYAPEIGAALVSEYQRTGVSFLTQVRNANAVESLYRAAEAGAVDPKTAGVGRRLLQRSPDFDQNSILHVSDAVRQATEAEMQAEGFQAGTKGQVLGVTETWKDVSDGNLKTAIGLYQGHNERTLVHEWNHRYWDRLPEEQRASYEEYHAASGKEGTAKEAFANEGADFFFDEGLASSFPKAAMALKSAKRGLLGLVGRVDASPGAKIPEPIRAMYKEAGLKGTPEAAGMGETAGEAAPSFKVAEAPKPLITVTPGKVEEIRHTIMADDLKPVTDKYAININFERIDSADAVKSLIQETARVFEPEMQAARRGKVSHEETIKEAQRLLSGELGVTPETLIYGWKRGQAPTAAEATAIRILMVKSGDHVMDLAKRIREGENSVENQVELLKAVEQHASIQAVAHGAAAEAGRALNAYRIVGQSDLYRQMDLRRILTDNGGNDAGIKLADAIADAAALKADGLLPMPALAEMVRKVRNPGWYDFANEIRIGGMLSGPLTHAANITGNFMTTLMTPAELALAAGIRKGKAKVGEKVNEKLSGYGPDWSKGVQGHEAKAFTLGVFNSFKEALYLGAAAFRTGTGDPALRGKAEGGRLPAVTSAFMRENLPRGFNSPRVWNGPFGKAFDYFGEAVRLPFRALIGADEFFFTLNYRGTMWADAYTEALGEGRAVGSPEFNTRISELLSNPTEAMVSRARDASKAATFTSDLESTTAQRIAAAAATPGGRIIMPFVRTPMNIFKYTNRRLPTGLVDPTVIRDIRNGGEAADLAMARITLGSMLMTVSGTLASMGMVTGGGPVNRAQREAWLLENQPYSVKLGDTWYSYSRIEPLGMILGIGADTQAVMAQWDGDDSELDHIALAVVAAYSRNLVSKTWMTGLSDFIDAVQDPEKQIERYMRSTAGSFLPFSGAIRTVERIDDPITRQVDSILDQFRTQIPGLSDDLPPRRNIWGNPMKAEHLPGALNAWLLPIQTKGKGKDPVAEEMIRLGMGISKPGRNLSIGGQEVKLTMEEWDRYIVLAGQEATPAKHYGLTLHDALESTMTSLKYEAAEDAGKAAIIHNVISDFRGSWSAAEKRFSPGSAKALLVEEFPRLAAIAEEEAQP